MMDEIVDDYYPEPRRDMFVEPPNRPADEWDRHCALEEERAEAEGAYDAECGHPGCSWQVRNGPTGWRHLDTHGATLDHVATPPQPAAERPACPDGGTCHHECATTCFRVLTCGPLPGVFEGDRWPAAGPAVTDPVQQQVIEVLRAHILAEPTGGTASGAECRCSCGHVAHVEGGLRTDAYRPAMLHIAQALAADGLLAPPPPPTTEGPIVTTEEHTARADLDKEINRLQGALDVKTQVATALREANTTTYQAGRAEIEHWKGHFLRLADSFPATQNDVLADAWDEGYAAGHDCVGARTDCTRRPNPYRTTDQKDRPMQNPVPLTHALITTPDELEAWASDFEDSTAFVATRTHGYIVFADEDGEIYATRPPEESDPAENAGKGVTVRLDSLELPLTIQTVGGPQ